MHARSVCESVSVCTNRNWSNGNKTGFGYSSSIPIRTFSVHSCVGMSASASASKFVGIVVAFFSRNFGTNVLHTRNATSFSRRNTHVSLSIRRQPISGSCYPFYVQSDIHDKNIPKKINAHLNIFRHSFFLTCDKYKNKSLML